MWLSSVIFRFDLKTKSLNSNQNYLPYDYFYLALFMYFLVSLPKLAIRNLIEVISRMNRALWLSSVIFYFDSRNQSSHWDRSDITNEYFYTVSFNYYLLRRTHFALILWSQWSGQWMMQSMARYLCSHSKATIRGPCQNQNHVTIE
jgi:hypothetical protein